MTITESGRASDRSKRLPLGYRGRELNSVDARHLILYSTPMPDDEHFEASLKQWRVKGQNTPRLSPAALSQDVVSGILRFV